MSQRKTMTENLFRAIKIMQKGGATAAEIEEYFNVSPATCSRVRKAETFEEYKNMCAAMALKQRELAKKKNDPEPQTPPEPPKPEQPKEPIGISTPYMNNRIFQLLKEQNDMLKLISNKLAFIVDELVR